jgi:hypothetical protein
VSRAIRKLTPRAQNGIANDLIGGAVTAVAIRPEIRKDEQLVIEVSKAFRGGLQTGSDAAECGIELSRTVA